MNKRAPKDLSRYVVTVIDKTKVAERATYKYFATQREAKTWGRGQTGKVRLFKIDYDFYGEL
jgi:hypothetical protein